MKDAYGRELEEGHLVAFALPNARSGGSARIALVIGFSPTKVRLRSRFDKERTWLRDPQRVTLLEDPNPPEHKWVKDEETGLSYCGICELAYSCWSGDPCDE